ncbi:sugar 3,4-ketoisomerase [Lacrimispora saccharolytica]|uniref:sugar 3,4-ketoisomerase n=1 Tax=Lacrimispora saccharolytica TaxID=84030 RepID=UPI00265CBBA3|nr:FdtA/QdtA family cupin domain-containing protein [Lacrimispora saccharolytica]MCF2657073.1 WxcM-like domain-containing protein [Lacrimispora saccharolytica]
MNVLSMVRTLEFIDKGDDRGHLIVVEGKKDIPFDIKRIFYIFGSDSDVIRGQHANRESEFVLINVSGKSKVRIKDGKGNEIIYALNRPHTGIYLPKMIWKEMYDFSEDSVLLCLTNTEYNPQEYIRDYSEYLSIINMNNKECSAIL